MEEAWKRFFIYLHENHPSIHIQRKKIAGTNFLYVEAIHRQSLVEESLRKAAAYAAKGKLLTTFLTFVRMDEPSNEYVYSLRFQVPMQKRFCCGKGCVDCVRFQNGP
ncbi:hypothetical protein ACFPU1_05685 [Thalassorhabdus alkalitolerans]|uniref:Uncharacterized protein n=1 Tax=Thalassorhabdus alkalitolerans TaxID=2282697 RepID=A0ABW0YLH8_9BACI|nr:hypothetical protein [Thalassobacillus sp. C254]